jgi:tetratricopeptide (TPR) repeat protein
VSISTGIFAAGADQKQVSDRDSLLNEVGKYSSDTSRFYVFSNYFWEYANKDLDRVKAIGDLAFSEIKNSKHLKALSDGYDIKGFIFREEENFDSASFCFEKALEISLGIAYNSRIAWSYYHLGELNYLFGNYRTALGQMKTALKYFRDLNYFNDIGSSLYYISDMYDRMGISDSSILFHNSRLTLFESHSDTVGEIVAGLAISAFYKERNDNKQSLEYLKVALRKAESMNNSQALIKVYFSIGDFFAEQKKNYTIAHEYYNRVLKFAEKNKYKILEAQLLNKIGNVYLLEANDSLALDYNLKSLVIAKESKHRHTISNAYKSLGMVYKKLGDYPSAINCFRICYETGCNICPVIKFHDALVELGDIYMLTGNYGESLIWYKKSLDLAERFNSVADISLSKFMIGNYYKKTGKPNDAGKYYSESFRLAEEAGNFLLTRRIADTMSLFFKSNNDFPSAYRYTKLSNALADSLFEIDRRADITELEMKFEIEKIRKENEARQSISIIEIKRQKTFRNFSVILSLVLFVSGFAVYAGYKRKKRDNNLLTYQKNQIEEKNEEIRSQVEEITSHSQRQCTK